MANIYAPPTEAGPVPDFTQFKDASGRWDFQAHLVAEQAWVDNLAAIAKRENPNTDLAGEILRFRVGDGYAVYVVWRLRPVELIHCPIGDNWTIPEAHERGLTAKDIREHVKHHRAMAALFSKKP